MTFSFIDATPKHADYLATRLRPIDALEVACVGSTPERSLHLSLTLPNSKVLTAVDQQDTPLFMCGVSQSPEQPDMGVVWLLASKEIMKHKRHFLKMSMPIFDDFLKGYKALYNFVHKDNKTSIRWLEWCGCTVDKSQPYDVGGHPFYLLIKEAYDE